MHRLVLQVCGFWLLLSSCEALQAQVKQASPLPSKRVLNRYGLDRVWWNHASLNPARDTVRHLVSDEDILYAQATSGMVTAFDIITGEKLWALQIGPRDNPSFPAISSGDLVLIATGTRLFALNKWNGSIQWQITLPVHPSTSPAIDKRNVYIGSLDGSLFAFDLKKIKDLYGEGLLPAWSYQTRKWTYKASKEISTPPLSTGNVITFASLDRQLYAVTSQRSELLYRMNYDKPISAPLVAVDGRLFVASEDRNFYCLNQENGSSIWEYPFGLPIRTSPAVINNNVYITPVRGGMYSFSTTTGKPQWWRPEVSDFIAATPKFVFASDKENNVILLDRKDGATLGSLPLRSFTKRILNDKTDRVFLATQGGLIVCLSEQGRALPLYYKNPDLRPILPEFAPSKPKPVTP